MTLVYFGNQNLEYEFIRRLLQSCMIGKHYFYFFIQRTSNEGLWAARDNSGHLSPFNFSRRSTGEEDVRFKVLYSGLCHSDLHHLPSCARV
ncbi:unnamed protein product, partial [Vitis vinifera]